MGGGRVAMRWSWGRGCGFEWSGRGKVFVRWGMDCVRLGNCWGKVGDRSARTGGWLGE